MDALPDDLPAIVAKACEWVDIGSLADAEWENARALKILQEEHGVQLRQFPEDVIASAKVATGEVMSELAMRDELTGKIVSSYRNAAIHLGKWSDVSVKSFLQARS